MSNQTTARTIINKEVNIKKEDFDHIIETLSIIKYWLIFVAIIIATIILIKFVKTCKKVYKVHNETVIRRHNQTTPQL